MFSTKQELLYDYKSAIPGSYVDIGGFCLISAFLCFHLLYWLA